MPFFHLTFIRRQLASTRSQSLIFVLCVALSMVTLVALRGFGDSVDRALTRDARSAHRRRRRRAVEFRV